jgi:beta-galactosidase/beta-glucuronidase
MLKIILFPADLNIQGNRHNIKGIILLACCILAGGWQYGQAADTYYELLKQNNADPILVLDQDWEVAISGNPKTQMVSLPYFLPDQVEQVIFKKIFNIADSLHDYKLRLHILGISGVATIKLNSKLIGKHLNLLSSFYLDLPADLLKLQPASENILEIVLRSPAKSEQSIPQVVQVFREKSWLGILREIYLEFIPPVFISDFKYTLTSNKLHYTYTISLLNTGGIYQPDIPPLQIREQLLAPDHTKLTLGNENIPLSTNQKNIERESLLDRVVSWYPRSPGQYCLEVVLNISGHGERSYRFPIYHRQVQIRQSGISVEGTPFVIRGISYREIYNDPTGHPLKFHDFYRKLSMDFQ